MYLKKAQRKMCSIADGLATKLSPGMSRVKRSADVYLTFDDGPDPLYTPALLELLSSRGHSATFFLIGQNTLQNKSLAKEIIGSGSSVGSHSSKHLRQWTTKTPDQMNDYREGHDQVETVIGKEINLFRPPYGHHDRRSVRFCQEKNLKNVLWNCESYDWQQDATRETIFSNVMAGLVPGNIILMHDSIYDNPKCADRSETIAAVEMILNQLETLGLRSSSLS